MVEKGVVAINEVLVVCKKVKRVQVWSGRSPFKIGSGKVVQGMTPAVCDSHVAHRLARNGK